MGFVLSGSSHGAERLPNGTDPRGRNFYFVPFYVSQPPPLINSLSEVRPPTPRTNLTALPPRARGVEADEGSPTKGGGNVLTSSSSGTEFKLFFLTAKGGLPCGADT